MKAILFAIVLLTLPLLSFSQESNLFHLVHDTATYNISGTLQGGGTFNVLSNDLRNLCDTTFSGTNLSLDLNSVHVTGSSSTPAYFTIQNNGNVFVNTFSNTIPLGTYTLSYTVCDAIYPAICANQTLTITVTNSFKMAANASSAEVIPKVKSTAKNSLQFINFPDANLKNVLIQLNSGRVYNLSNTDYIDADANHDGEIDTNEALLVGGLNLSGSNISNLTGLEYFTNLFGIQAANNAIGSLNTLNVPSLNYLFLYFNPLNEITTNNLPNLIRLGIGDTPLTALNVSASPQLEWLFCSNATNLSTINIKNTSSLDYASSFMQQDCWVNCTSLNNICADADEIPALQAFLAGCGVSTSGITINSDCALGTEHFSADTVTLHPNPVTNLLTIDFRIPLVERSSYELYDVLGKKVVEGIIAAGVYSVPISFENYPQGIYLLRLKLGDKIISKKIVKE